MSENNNNVNNGKFPPNNGYTFDVLQKKSVYPKGEQVNENKLKKENIVKNPEEEKISKNLDAHADRQNSVNGSVSNGGDENFKGNYPPPPHPMHYPYPYYNYYGYPMPPFIPPQYMHQHMQQQANFAYGNAQNIYEQARENINGLIQLNELLSTNDNSADKNSETHVGAYKSAKVVVLLAIFFSFIGADCFYLHKIFGGLLKIFLAAVTIFSFVMIYLMKMGITLDYPKINENIYYIAGILAGAFYALLTVVSIINSVRNVKKYNKKISNSYN